VCARVYVCVDLSSVSGLSEAPQTGCSSAAVGSNATSSTEDATPSTSSHEPSIPGNGGGGGERSEAYLVKPLLSPLYSINPFCIPVKYLGLLQRPADWLTVDRDVLPLCMFYVLLHAERFGFFCCMFLGGFPFDAVTLLVWRQEGFKILCWYVDGDDLTELCTSYSSSCHHSPLPPWS